jgi:Flp pilus assembly protein TadG
MLRARREEGQAILEFAFIFSMLAMLVLGIVTFGITFYDQILLSNATSDAAKVVMAGAGVITDPCGSVNSALAAAAPSLNNPSVYGTSQGQLQYTITAYTTTGSASSGPNTVSFSGSGTSCTTLAASLTEYQQVVVKATYGCNLTIFGHNFAPNCLLTAQTSEAVQ